MPQELEKAKPPVNHGTAPQNIGENAWLAAQKLRTDVEKAKIELYKNIIELLKENLPHYKDYMEKKIYGTLKATLAFLATVVGLATLLAIYDKIGGETIAFLMGTLAGYAISLAAKYLQ